MKYHSQLVMQNTLVQSSVHNHKLVETKVFL